MSAERVNQLVEAGLWLRLSGDVDGASRLFAQALKLEPGNTRVRELLASPGEGGGAELPEELRGPPGAASAEPTPPARALAPVKTAPTASRTPPPLKTGRGGAAPEPVVHPPLPSATPPPLKTGRGRSAAERVGAPPPVQSVASENRGDEVARLTSAARELLQLDNHSGALDLIHKGLALVPHHPQLTQMKDRSEATLQTMYESKMGDLNAKPRVLMRDDEVIWLNLDHRAGFVLAQIDGTVTFEEVFLVSGMSRLDTARILAQLHEERVIGVA